MEKWGKSMKTACVAAYNPLDKILTILQIGLRISQRWLPLAWGFPATLSVKLVVTGRSTSLHLWT